MSPVFDSGEALCQRKSTVTSKSVFSNYYAGFCPALSSFFIQESELLIHAIIEITVVTPGISTVNRKSIENQHKKCGFISMLSIGPTRCKFGLISHKIFKYGLHKCICTV